MHGIGIGQQVEDCGRIELLSFVYSFSLAQNGLEEEGV